MEIFVHWVRHGEVASHRGDVPVTEAGLAAAQERGSRLGELVAAGEEVHFCHATTLRTRQTAAAVRAGVVEAVARRGVPGLKLHDLRLEPVLRNPDMYVAGRRVDFVSTPEALAAQIPDVGLAPADLLRLPFWPNFWGSQDRIGYWVNHTNPPGEDAATVARRLLAWAASLHDLPADQPRRFICVTHSPLLRAFLKSYLLGEDPGEPEFSESIDMHLPAGGPVRIRFREHAALLP